MFRLLALGLALVLTTACASAQTSSAQTSPATVRASALPLVRAGDAAKLNAFWQAQPDAATLEMLGEALREAITAHDEPMAKAILARAKTPEEFSAVIETTDKQGRNALFYAVEANAPALVSLLLEKGADLSRRTPFSIPVLASDFLTRTQSVAPIRATIRLCCNCCCKAVTPK